MVAALFSPDVVALVLAADSEQEEGWGVESSESRLKGGRTYTLLRNVCCASGAKERTRPALGAASIREVKR